MNERDVQRAMKRLCTAAMAGNSYHPEVCQRCESPCRYGVMVLRSHGLCRTAAKETPTERSSMGSRRIRNRLLGYNRYSITR